jgi:hypothetical protein
MSLLKEEMGPCFTPRNQRHDLWILFYVNGCKLSGFRHTNTCVTRVILSGQWMTSTEYFTRNRIYYRVRA